MRAAVTACRRLTTGQAPQFVADLVDKVEAVRLLHVEDYNLQKEDKLSLAMAQNKLINLDDFMECMQNAWSNRRELPLKLWREAFDRADLDKSGSIDVDEFVQVQGCSHACNSQRSSMHSHAACVLVAVH